MYTTMGKCVAYSLYYRLTVQPSKRVSGGFGESWPFLAQFVAGQVDTLVDSECCPGLERARCGRVGLHPA